MTAIDPRHPVLIGAHELSVRSGDGEPIAMMSQAAREALADSGADLARHVDSVRVVKGIWPYKNPGRLVAKTLGLSDDVTTALTGIGGNATYDLASHTAQQIMTGELDVAVICGAESMRTRRMDRSQGRRSSYVPEAENAAPDLVVASDVPMADGLDTAAEVDHPVNFYAMADSVIRHLRKETPSEHLHRIASLWAEGSAVAASNPHAWIRDAMSAEEIATSSPTNRMVAAPYTKLLTSNINVDQGAAVVLCSHQFALDRGISADAMVFLAAASGGSDHLPIRARLDLDRSPAFRLSAQRALALADQRIDDIDHLDLYSCFPASVQLARTELGIGTERPFTMTGGLTFAGGPFNGYCTQALAHAVAVLRGSSESALLYGNGGYFSKHSVLVLSGSAPQRRFAHQRVDNEVTNLPRRTPITEADGGRLEAYTVTFDRDGAPDRAILSVIDVDGGRLWAVSSDESTMHALLADDLVGHDVLLQSSTEGQVPDATVV